MQVLAAILIADLGITATMADVDLALRETFGDVFGEDAAEDERAA